MIAGYKNNSPQTYLQRPSSWGRATAGRQDVVSHVHTAMRKVSLSSPPFALPFPLDAMLF